MNKGLTIQIQFLTSLCVCVLIPPDLGLPTNNQNWPEEFGFRLGGVGPSYILSVLEGSSAFLAGLQPGDQVVDIEGQDVTNLSTPALIALAQTLKTVPPSIGVVSRLEQVGVFLWVVFLILSRLAERMPKSACAFNERCSLVILLEDARATRQLDCGHRG